MRKSKILASFALAFTLFMAAPAQAVANEEVHDFNYVIVPPASQCTARVDEVVGLQSPKNETSYIVRRVMNSGRVKRLTERLRKFYRDVIGTRSNYVVHLNYVIPDAPEIKNKEIQLITLEMPPRFHLEAEYELSCEANGRIVNAYRRYMPKLHNQNYEEPPVSVLPADCTGVSGTVTVRANDYASGKAIEREFKKAVFHAAYWNPLVTQDNPETLDIYLPRQSYQPGDTIDIRIHAADNITPVKVDLVRVGSRLDAIATLDGIKASRQKITPFSFRDGVNWPVTASLTLPSDAPSGYYIAVVSQNGGNAGFVFVVRPPATDKTKIAVIAATNTWNAYNAWGGGSFYRNDIGTACLGIPYAPVISTQRPRFERFPPIAGTTGDHTSPAEYEIAKWLESEEYDYVVYADSDLNADPSFLSRHKIILLPSHTEYHTTAMYDALEGVVDRGGNIVSLGGNVLYYRVTMKDTRIEKYTNGQRHDLDGQYGGFWSAHLDRSPASLLGLDYDARDYDTHAPFRVTNADHWAFKGTGLKNGDLFADKGSGHEIDVITSQTPPGAVQLAKGTNPNGFGADMVWLEHPSGGKTFAVGSISFFYALMRDQKLGILMNNVIQRMLGESQPEKP